MDLRSDLWASSSFRVLFTVLCLVLAQLVIRNFLAQAVHRIVRSHHYTSKHEEKQREETLITIFRTTSAVVLWVVGVILILTELGLRIGPLLTSAGVIGVVVGFGAQKTIRDFLSGLFIILENQYRVDDIITLTTPGGVAVSGQVESVTIRITRLRDLDGSLHVVQNGDIAVVTNQSFGYSNVNVDVRMGYDTDVGLAEEVINKVGKAIAADKKWHERVVEPIHFLRVERFGEAGMEVKALGRVQPGVQWDVAGEFRRRVIPALERAGIDIPLQPWAIQQSSQTGRRGNR